jgi:hypothetical protein
MSNQGPPKTLETIVGAMLPSACRENVLGDLCERYRSNRQYLCEALATLPLLVASRIRRTADGQIVLIEAFAAYLSFMAAGWQFYGSPFFYDHSGFLRLAVPAIAAIACLLVFDAYFESRALGAPLAVAAGVSFQFLLAGLIPSLSLPAVVVLVGGASTALLVSGLRSVLQASPLRPLRQATERQRVDPYRMSPEEIRAAALRLHKRARAVRIALRVGIQLPVAVWVFARWHSPSPLYSLGCFVSLAGSAFSVYVIQNAFSCGHLEPNPSLEMCREFYRGSLERRLNLLRCAWPRVLGPLLVGPLIVFAADPSIQILWMRISSLVLVTLFYGAVGWFARRRAPVFQRQIDALDRR